MKHAISILIISSIFLVACSRPAHSQEQKLGLSKDQVLQKIMIPLARQFIRTNGLPYDIGFGTNSIKRYNVDLYEKKPGGDFSLTLTNGCFFLYFWDGTNSEIRFYSDGTKTFYNLARASKEKIQAVKELSLRNKLNDATALELARHYFKLQGHKEEDFLLPEFGPYSWGEKGDPDYIQYPIYRAHWYRKDVKLKDRNEGVVTLPDVTITVSGITSNMVNYSKCFMPIGRDF
jgi:hypothetical protein